MEIDEDIKQAFIFQFLIEKVIRKKGEIMHWGEFVKEVLCS